MGHFSKIAQYWHTLRYLKAVQFYGRVWFKLSKPKPDSAPAPDVRSTNRNFETPARRAASLLGPETFLFLGKSGRLSDIGWDGEECEKLWRYNQHYFDDLNAIHAEDRREWQKAILSDWVKNNLPAKGNGWEPYPTSLRIVNWIKWALTGNDLTAESEQSLAVQARWLTRRLEIHLLGNHLFSNAKALIFAGLYFEGNEADRWLALGFKILSREIKEQILTDGGHFERSTMYHALALEDMLDLYNITNTYPDALSAGHRTQVKGWPKIVLKMHRWLQVMMHPDNRISFFNDSAFGVAPSIGEINEYAARLGFDDVYNFEPIEWLEDSGYARLERDSAVVFLDMAPVGPDHLPGHAHADTLSVELSLFGQRILVNSGTSCYGVNDERLRQRGTAAHNTVIVNGHNSSEVWSGFRVARRARPIEPELYASDILTVSCSHNGYAHLGGKPIHRRTWQLSNKELMISDSIAGVFDQAEARYHFHPDVVLSFNNDDEQSGEGVLPDGRRFFWQSNVCGVNLESTTWHPKFGTSIQNHCLVLKLEQGKCKFAIKWEL